MNLSIGPPPASAGHQLLLAELEREKDFLQQRVVSLERTNKELASLYRQTEETIAKIQAEEDPEKRMTLLQVNLIRRKSLLRV